MAIVIMKRHRKSQPKHNHYNEIRSNYLSLTCLPQVLKMINVVLFHSSLPLWVHSKISKSYYVIFTLLQILAKIFHLFDCCDGYIVAG